MPGDGVWERPFLPSQTRGSERPPLRASALANVTISKEFLWNQDLGCLSTSLSLVSKFRLDLLTQPIQELTSPKACALMRTSKNLSEVPHSGTATRCNNPYW